VAEALPQIYLARHGETAWTATHQHTGRTELPLTPRGEDNARRLGERLRDHAFDLVLTSPRQRARDTAALAGFGARAQIDENLAEWDYGAYEGRKTVEIRRERPDWFLFRDGCPEGESVSAVGARADRVVERLRSAGGNVLLFGHAHFFRVLAARWLGLEPGAGRLLLMSVASLSILGYEHSLEEPAIALWNDNRHAQPG
jgi:probable phosphoglycerate mutase